jgi:hypothetical protein
MIIVRAITGVSVMMEPQENLDANSKTVDHDFKNKMDELTEWPNDSIRDKYIPNKEAVPKQKLDESKRITMTL